MAVTDRIITPEGVFSIGSLLLLVVSSFYSLN